MWLMTWHPVHSDETNETNETNTPKKKLHLGARIFRENQ